MYDTNWTLCTEERITEFKIYEYGFKNGSKNPAKKFVYDIHLKFLSCHKNVSINPTCPARS